MTPKSFRSRTSAFTSILLAVLLVSATASRPLAADGDPAALLNEVKLAAAAGRVTKTAILGHNIGHQDFSEMPTGSGLLVGFDFGLGKGANDGITGLRPIYLTAAGEKTAPVYGTLPAAGAGRTVTVKARPGYAVGGAKVLAGLWVDGMSLQFMRILDTGLDPQDAYTSDWVGKPGQGRDLGGSGAPVIGLVGSKDATKLWAIGLLQTRAEAAAAATPPAMQPVKPGPGPNAPNAPSAPRGAAAPPNLAPAANPWMLLIGLVGVAGLGVLLAGRLYMLLAQMPPEVEYDADDFSGASTAPKSEPASFLRLPPELQDKMREELSRGETIIWAGQPSPRVTRWKVIASAVGFALPLLFVAFIADVLLFGPANPPWLIFPFLGVVMFITALGAIFAPMQAQAAARKTAYVLTNRRALVRQGQVFFGNQQVESYSPVQLHAMERHDSWIASGAGDLVFRTRVQATVAHYGRAGSSVRFQIKRFGFLGVPHAVKVERLLRETLIDRLVDKLME